MAGLRSRLSGAINDAANPLATVLGKQNDPLIQKLNNPLQQVVPVLGDMRKGSRQMVNSFASLWKKNGGDALDVGNKPPSPPAPPPVVPMPDQEAIDAAARRARQRQFGRTGFASTILSAASGSQQQTTDRLGP